MLFLDVLLVFFFFFKQKTAYEMRISDWSSDVCSSDLQTVDAGAGDDVIHGLTTLTDADVINGGAGADTLTIGVAEAGYAGTGIAFNGNLTNVETIDLVAGLDATTTAPGTANTYAFTFVDANIAAGGTLTVDGSELRDRKSKSLNSSH